MEATEDRPKPKDPAPLTDELDDILAEIDRVLDDGEPEPETEDGDDG